MLVSMRPVSTFAVWALMPDVNGDTTTAVTLGRCSAAGSSAIATASGPRVGRCTGPASEAAVRVDSKEYPSAADAARYAAAFDREDRSELGRRAPFLGMFPLRLWWTLRRRHEADSSRRSAGR